jgi:hypothetical protein
MPSVSLRSVVRRLATTYRGTRPRRRDTWLGRELGGRDHDELRVALHVEILADAETGA